MVEALGHVAGQLHVLLLILPHRHKVRLVEQDVRRHQAGVGKQAGVDVVGVLGGFVLELGHAGQLAEHGVALQHPGQLRVLVHVGLDKNCVALRVQTAGDVLGHLLQSAAAELRRGLAHGDGMHIGHKVEAVELVRPGAPVLDGPQVVAQVELAAGLDAGEHDFFLVFHSKTHLLRVIFGSLGTMPHIGLSYHIQMALTILRRKI